MKLKKGDKVKVMAGKDRGKEGTIDKVFPNGNKVSVGGVNIYKRHSRPQSEGQKGGIIELSRPLAVSVVALICPKCKQPTRIGYRLTGKTKVRVCRKCDQQI